VDGGEGEVSKVEDESLEAPEDLQQAVDDAERDLAEGNWIENSDMLVKLKQWAGEVPGDKSPG
jgi:hypothetical protein